MTPSDIQRIRDALAEGLTVRKGMLLTDEIIRDRAANLTEYLRPIVDDIVKAALVDAARGEVVTGEISGARPRSLAGETGMRLEEHVAGQETDEELARRLIK